MSSALRMIARCAKHQTEEARHPTVAEVQAVQSRESSLPGSLEGLEPEPMGNGEPPPPETTGV